MGSLFTLTSLFPNIQAQNKQTHMCLRLGKAGESGSQDGLAHAGGLTGSASTYAGLARRRNCYCRWLGCPGERTECWLLTGAWGEDRALASHRGQTLTFCGSMVKALGGLVAHSLPWPRLPPGISRGVGEGAWGGDEV